MKLSKYGRGFSKDIHSDESLRGASCYRWSLLHFQLDLRRPTSEVGSGPWQHLLHLRRALLERACAIEQLGIGEETFVA
jgi:hypothetical protein